MYLEMRSKYELEEADMPRPREEDIANVAVYNKHPGNYFKNEKGHEQAEQPRLIGPSLKPSGDVLMSLRKQVSEETIAWVLSSKR